STTGWMSRMGMRPITRLPYPVVIHRFALGVGGHGQIPAVFSPVWAGPGPIAAFADQPVQPDIPGHGEPCAGGEPRDRTATRMSALHSWVITGPYDDCP